MEKKPFLSRDVATIVGTIVIIIAVSIILVVGIALVR